MTDRMQELGEIFSRKYNGADPDWAGESGPGSDPYFNIPYRSFLENFIRMNNIGSIVDIGCGDWQFSRYLDLRNIDYLGLDIVPSLVSSNQSRFGGGTVRFERMPDRLEDVPGAHLLIIKDVLQHLDTAMIRDFIKVVFPKFVFCLVTNSHRKVAHDGSMMPVNSEITPGGFRCLDLREDPFRVKGGYVLRFYTGVAEEIRTLLVQP